MQPPKSPIHKCKTAEELGEALAEREEKALAAMETERGRRIRGSQERAEEEDEFSSSDEDSLGLY